MASEIKNLISKKDGKLSNPPPLKYMAISNNLEFQMYEKRSKKDRDLQNPILIKNPLINKNKLINLKKSNNSKMPKKIKNPQLLPKGSVIDTFQNYIDSQPEKPFLKIDSNVCNERLFTSGHAYDNASNNSKLGNRLPKISNDKQKAVGIEKKIQIIQPIDAFIDPLKLGISVRFQALLNFITQKNDLFPKGPVINSFYLPLPYENEFIKQTRIVYDSFEKSTYNSKFEYCKEVESFVDESFNSYPLVAGGKGAPKKSSINKLIIRRKLEPYYIPINFSDNTLIFESRFECGNLRRAVQINEYEYDLFMNPDYGTTFTQFFYFKVNNTKTGINYKFNIVNFIKTESVFTKGLLLNIYSVISSERDDLGWHRGGSSISYYKNNIIRKGSSNYYTLSFKYQFKYENDTVFFASIQPYSYSDLRKFLSSICSEKNQNIIKYCIVGKTLSGNSIYSLLITDFNSSFQEIGRRKSIIFTSRIHPGEANSSFIIESIINFLIGNSKDAIILRKFYIFKIIPMLNPDGVICGNYRCSLNGVDLNRQWIDPREILAQEICAVKELIKRTSESREIELFCDFHGHFRKHNIFLYGCETISKNEQIFPSLLEKRSKVFNIKDCKNNIEKEKESTARVVVHREFNVIQSYTCESSMLGSNLEKYNNYHFSKSIYNEFGIHFCQALLDLIQNSSNYNISLKKELYIPYPDSKEMNDSKSKNLFKKARFL